MVDQRETATSWTSQAFGLNVTGDFDAPGLSRGARGSEDLPAVRATTISPEEAAAAWPGEDAERLLNWRYENGSIVMSIDRHPQAGYRLYAIQQGVHLLSADGALIRSAVEGCEPWIWQRYMVGQVLPLAAVVHGYEVMHASAVAVGGTAVGFVAESGVGKTSLALNLVLRGARLLADDVAAVELVDGHPIVHPGPRLTNLRHEESAVMGARRDALGEVIGEDREAIRLVLEGDADPAPLGALYFLERGAAAGAASFERRHDVGFDELMSSRFTRFLATPQRLRNQLDVFAAVARQVPIFRLRIPTGMSAAQLSERVEAHVRDGG
jgi:hypothetical protein